MKKNKMFEMVIDGGEETGIFKFCRKKKKKKDVMNRYSGSGEFITIKDVTKLYPISKEAVATALRGFGDAERNAILSLMDEYYENTVSR
jgi:beta-mannanase